MTWVEKSMHEHARSDRGVAHGMCDGWSDAICRGLACTGQHGEQTWQRSGPLLVERGERAELERIKQTGVYECVSRDTARRDMSGTTVNMKGVRTNKRIE